MSVSPDLKLGFYSDSNTDAQTFNSGLLNISNENTTPITLKTLPEKCVWSQLNNSVVYCAVPDSIPRATYPDQWYQGIVSFSDSIWMINTKTGVTKDLAPLRQISNGDIDAINLSLDSKEDYLTFMNKRDLSLWGLQLNASSSSL